MRLRAFIEGATGPTPTRPTLATLATPATHEAGSPQNRPAVATVATLPEPECWAGMMRGLTIDGVRLDLAAAVLDSLMDAGTIERALILGWDARELVGLHRAKPHDHPARAGLVYSLRVGDSVSSVHDAGCAIVVAGGPAPHLWRRGPLTDSIFLPWTLTEPCLGSLTYRLGRRNARRGSVVF
jgi:hypothetical protein